ncbi:MAG: ATP-binding cassette domain-containing protein [Planctomycetaceae bacterium]|nr:ATP-binding cassette domain-containing protein [Planctomycetaceae bacterium]
MTNYAIELNQVTKRFGKQTAVDQIDLAVPEGAIYGFIGPNGSGKTTTLRMILRIFQPDEGVVTVLGGAHGRTADNRLGYLPEERGLYKRMKVRNVLKYYARLKGFYDCQSEIDFWLERLGASEWANKRVDALSKGMAQKIQFISAVVAKPKLVILDEPFSGLDPVNLDSLRAAVLSLRENGTTIVFSTHDMEMAEKMCDTIFMIFRGKKVLDGTLSSIQADYPADEVRVQVDKFPQDGGVNERGETPVPAIDGISEVHFDGRFHRFRLDHPDCVQEVLSRLSGMRSIKHFEVVKPSLHDIFVKIAKPHTDGA